MTHKPQNNLEFAGHRSVIRENNSLLDKLIAEGDFRKAAESVARIEFSSRCLGFMLNDIIYGRQMGTVLDAGKSSSHEHGGAP